MPICSTIWPINWPSRCWLASTTAGRFMPSRFARSQNIGIDGNASCQNTTISGGPSAMASNCASPSTRQRRLRATRTKYRATAQAITARIAGDCKNFFTRRR